MRQNLNKLRTCGDQFAWFASATCRSHHAAHQPLHRPGYDSVEHLKHDVEACDERLRSLRKQLQAAKNVSSLHQAPPRHRTTTCFIAWCLSLGSEPLP